jgi:hypothetical protein
VADRARRRSASAVTAAALLLSFFRSTDASAQASDPHAVQPERPTVATHAGTVAPGWLEIEAGGELDHSDDHPRGVALPIVAKLGLASHVQLSLFASVVRPPEARTFQAGDLAVGVKWRLADDMPILGRLALLPSVKLPTGSKGSGAGTGTVDASLLVISSHDLGRVTIDINAGYTRRSGNGSAAPRDATLWTFSFGGPAVGAVGWVAELYGYPPTAGPAGHSNVMAFLFGPTLAVRSWLAFDLGVIAPVTGPQPHALYLGGVWNVGHLWK